MKNIMSKVLNTKGSWTKSRMTGSKILNLKSDSLNLVQGLRDPELNSGSHERVSRRGFTLVETLMAVSIFVLILGALTAFTRDVFFFNDVIQTGLNNVTQARKVLRPFVNEVRSAQQSDLGAFALAQVATSSFAFYADIDNDGSREKIRYFLDGNTFKKSTIEASGNPLVYDINDEEIVQVVGDVVATSSIFTYYDGTYDGYASTTPLSQPVTSSDVRLVRVDLTVDTDPNRAPSLLTITIQATVRNLKDDI